MERTRNSASICQPSSAKAVECFLNFFFVVNFSLFIALLRESAAGKAASKKKKKAAMYGLTQFKDWRAAK